MIALSSLFIILFGALPGDEDGSTTATLVFLFIIGIASLIVLSMIAVLVKPTQRLIVILEPAMQVGSVQVWSNDNLESRIDLGEGVRMPFRFEVQSTYGRHEYHQVWLYYASPERSVHIRQFPKEAEANAMLASLRTAYGTP